MTYSDKEIELIKYFGFLDICEKVEPIVLYRMMVEYAFCNALEGKAVDSLRRCMISYKNEQCYRMTPKWDSLIDL